MKSELKKILKQDLENYIARKKNILEDIEIETLDWFWAFNGVN